MRSEKNLTNILGPNSMSILTRILFRHRSVTLLSIVMRLYIFTGTENALCNLFSFINIIVITSVSVLLQNFEVWLLTLSKSLAMLS